MTARTKIEQLDELIKESILGELVEQTVETLVPPGENFGSVIYKVDFKVEVEGKEKTYHAVAKCTPPNKVIQELFHIQDTVKAEIGWYTTLIPTIGRFQREHGVEVADFFQTFYGSRISLDPKSNIVDIDAVILTENLKPLGYKNVDRHIGFDLKTSKSILHDLAIFHAVPMAIKLKDKELFDKNIKPYLPGIQIQEDPSTKDKDQYKDLKIGLQEIPEVFPYMDRIATNLKENKLQKRLLTVKEPWGSICHNDFWINNIMVTEEDHPKTMFIDFQFPSYGSIAIDVLFFLVVSVNLEVLKEHNMDEFLKFYWDEFLKNLKPFGVDDSIFTYEDFLKEANTAAGSGLFGRALFHTYIVLADKGHTDFDSTDENYTKEDLEKFKVTLNNKHKEKYKWIVLEFVKRGWI